VRANLREADGTLSRVWPRPRLRPTSRTIRTITAKSKLVSPLVWEDKGARGSGLSGGNQDENRALRRVPQGDLLVNPLSRSGLFLGESELFAGQPKIVLASAALIIIMAPMNNAGNKDTRFSNPQLLRLLSSVVSKGSHSEYLAARRAHYAIEQQDSAGLTSALESLHCLLPGFHSYI